ncbi:MAG TPA: L-threonylcarbamoyladenylate synthase, partial [Ktedonobacteraceae bacterium]|nr:L-threonylcarbamoyladenylate synthase [Ktedonobacteraceae bacterium]
MQDIQTEVVQVNLTHPEPAVIARAATLLREGQLVVFPTETVYGLGGDALQPSAVEQIFAAKGRPFNDPMIVHIADESSLELLVTEVPAQARRLAEAFWPGPLTMILPAGPRVPGLVTSGLPTVAIRMPRHPIALALIRATGSPIAAPSANRFMHVSPTTAQHALADLNGRVPLILDGGPCEVGVESTVLDLCAPVPTILRPGGVSLEALRTVLPEVQPPARRQIKHEDSHSEDTAHKSPGQLLIHYAPTVPAFLFEGTVVAMRAAMLAEIQRRQARNEQVGVLIADEDVEAFQGSGAHIYTLGSTAEQVATRLFAGLRTLEDVGVQVILCRSFEAQGLGLAVH